MNERKRVPSWLPPAIAVTAKCSCPLCAERPGERIAVAPLPDPLQTPPRKAVA